MSTRKRLPQFQFARTELNLVLLVMRINNSLEAYAREKSASSGCQSATTDAGTRAGSDR